MNEHETIHLYYASNQGERHWNLYECRTPGEHGPEDRLIASHIPTAMWAEAMVEWANSLKTPPALCIYTGA